VSRIALAISLGVVSCSIAIASPAPPAHHATMTRHAQQTSDPCASRPSKWQRDECEDFSHSAPGDEYFGPLKISYLGIDNTAHDVAIEAGAYTTDRGLISKVTFADDALREWSHKYPGDPQLPRSYFLMIRVMKKIYTQSMQQEAWTYMQHVVHVYPRTYFAKIIRADIAHGYTEHWFAQAQPCPTPARNQVGELTTVATPVPTPRTRPGQPRIDIMTPPCIQLPQTVVDPPSKP
jgi:hypothetical protein